MTGLKGKIKKLEDSDLKVLNQTHSSLLVKVLKELIDSEIAALIAREPQPGSSPYTDSYYQGKRKGIIMGLSAYSEVEKIVKEEMGARRKKKA